MNSANSNVGVLATLTILIIVENTLGQSLDGDVVGKLVVGYQGWFGCPNDSSPRNSWVHWIKNSSRPLVPGNCHFEVYPDMREYINQYITQMGNFGNGAGGPSTLFSSWNPSSVNLHFKWMQQYNLDCAEIQRFGTDRQFPLAAQQMDGVLRNVIAAAQTYQRKFYIKWDISGWTGYAAEIQTDLNYLNQTIGVFNSPFYARQNGKLVVAVWGFGFRDRPNSTADALNTVNFLKQKGLYVIGGVPSGWRFNGQNSIESFQEQVYPSFHMLQPWLVGAYNSIQTAANYKTIISGDFNVTRSRGQDYHPVVFPGFAWSNWNGGAPNQVPRLNGRFMWQQFVNLRQLGIRNCYIAMFDEYDEGTAIAKAAENSGMKPANQYFLTLDADGGDLSSDFYLRCTNDGSQMLKGNTPLNTVCPTPFRGPPPNAATTSNTQAALAMLQSILSLYGLM